MLVRRLSVPTKRLEVSVIVIIMMTPATAATNADRQRARRFSQYRWAIG